MGRYLLHSLQIDMGDRCWTGMDRIMAGGIGRQMDDRCLRKMGLRGGGCHEAKPALLSCHVSFFMIFPFSSLEIPMCCPIVHLLSIELVSFLLHFLSEK